MFKACRRGSAVDGGCLQVDRRGDRRAKIVRGGTLVYPSLEGEPWRLRAR